MPAVVKLGDWPEIQSTVDSRYFELGYLEFCDVRNVYLYQKYILIAFSNNNLALGTFLQVQIIRGLFYKFKLSEVQINLHFG